MKRWVESRLLKFLNWLEYIRAMTIYESLKRDGKVIYFVDSFQTHPPKPSRQDVWRFTD